MAFVKVYILEDAKGKTYITANSDVLAEFLSQGDADNPIKVYSYNDPELDVNKLPNDIIYLDHKECATSIDNVLDFILLIRDTANKEMVRIFTCGGCYRFHLILKRAFPEAVPYMVISSDDKIKHVVTKINDKFYDVNGIYENIDEIRPMNDEQMQFAEGFKYPVMQEDETKIRNALIKRKKLALNILKVLNLFLLITAIGILRKVSFSEGINIILTFFLVGIDLRIVVASFFNIDANFCPGCGRRLN